MTIIQSIVLGIIQGITEFLPVSSSGHLVLVPFIFDWPQQSLAFDTTVHLGTLLAVILYFKTEVIYIAKTSGTVARKILDKPTLLMDIENFNGDRLPVLLVIGTIPVAIAGLLFGDRISTATSSPYIVSAVLIIFGLIMWYVDEKFDAKKKLSQVDFFDSIMVGAMQALALIRGTSRSGATITAGRYLGFSRTGAAKFSFLLSIPAVLLAGGYKLFQLAVTPASIEVVPMIIGFATSFVSGYVAIKFLMGLLQRRGLKPFVLYRVVLGIAILLIATLKNFF